jgi:drug/metabolite transporter (DMT)-like permease
MLSALSVLWGGSFFFVAIAVREVPPLSVVLLRVAIAAAVLLLIVRVSGLRMPKGGAAWAALVGMGILNNVVPFNCFVWAQSHIPSGVASILNATTPLFGVVVAHVMTRDEKATGPRLVGVLTGLAGVVVMIGPSALGGMGDLLPMLACLAGALSYALSGVVGRRFAKLGINPVQIAAGQVSASTVMMLPIALVFDRPWTLPAPSLTAWAAIVALAVFSTALAYVLFFRILATAGATNLLLVTFLIPVSALLLGTLVLGETIGLRQLGGMALIGLGLAAIDGRLISLARTRLSPRVT